MSAAVASADQRTGIFIAVVGPSGAGKDSLIDHARSALADDAGIDARFVRRVVTREADAGAEDHDTLSDDAFTRAEKSGAFALSWEAHGLRYGIPSTVDAEIAAGAVVIANLSRAAIPALRARYPRTLVVEVTAAPEVLAARLAGRGRESAADVMARLARSAGSTPVGDLTIRNDASLKQAGDAFVRAIRAAASG